MSGLCVLSIGPVRDEDIAFISILLREEEWSGNINSLTSIIRGFGRDDVLVARSETCGLVGVIGAFRQNEHLGYIGLFIIAREYRGKGYGKLLFGHALEHLRDRNVILDAALPVVNFYMKRGFIDAKSKVYLTNLKISMIPKQSLPEITSSKYHITEVKDDNIEQVMTYDMTLHPCGYRKYVRDLLLQESTLGFCLMGGTEVNGLCLYDSDTCRMGFYATDVTAATALLGRMICALQEAGPNDVNVSMEFPESSLDNLTSVLKSFGVNIEPHVGSTRMFNKHNVDLRLDNIYCYVSTRCLVL